MKTACSLALLIALTAVAHADDKKTGDKGNALDNSPWSVKSINKNDGYFGSSSTTVTRDVGDGWALGGKMTTPYEDKKIGGSGAPGLKQFESPNSNTTVIGPVLEKKF